MLNNKKYNKEKEVIKELKRIVLLNNPNLH